MELLPEVGGENLMQRFRAICFEHFVDIEFGSKFNVAYHHIVARLIKMGPDDPIFCFFIRGEEVSLIVRDYALISGLTFGGSPFDPTAQCDMRAARTYQAFFGGASVKVPDFVRRVLDQSRMLQGRDQSDQYLRAALVCVAHGIVFGSDRVVDQWVWALGEDLDAFNQFPWGAYSYRLLGHHIKSASSGRGKDWHLYGPQWIIIIWAFERIPGFADICEVRRHEGELMYPRYLRWGFKLKPKEQPADWQVFFENQDLGLWTIEPDEQEWQSPYYFSAENPYPLAVSFAAPDNLFVHRLQPLRRQGPARKSVDAVSTSTSAAGARRRGDVPPPESAPSSRHGKGLQDVDVDPELQDVDIELGAREQFTDVDVRANVQ